MKNYHPPRLVLKATLFLLLLLSACNNSNTSQPETTFDIFEQGNLVPLVVTQAVSLDNHLHMGLDIQALDTLHMTTLSTLDLHGRPFVNLTFTTPEPVEDIWEYAAKLAEASAEADVLAELDVRAEVDMHAELNVSNQDTKNSDLPQIVTITGATTIREPVTTTGSGIAMLVNMHNTMQKFDNASLESIVAIDPQIFFLKDTRGNYWRVIDQALVSEEEMEHFRGLYDEAITSNNTLEFVASLREAWRSYTDPDYQPSEVNAALYEELLAALDAGEHEHSNQLMDEIYANIVEENLPSVGAIELQSFEDMWHYWEQFAHEDGSLNISAWHESSKNQLSSKIVDRQGGTLHWINTGHIGNNIEDHGRDINDYLPPGGFSTSFGLGGLQATQGGFQQRREHYDEKVYRYSNSSYQVIVFTSGAENPQLPPRSDGITGFNARFDTIACVTGSHADNKALGCGPSAFIGLVGRKFNDGAVIDGMSKYTHTWQQLRIHMMAEIGTNGRPRIANYMGSCYVGQGQSLTLGDGFRNGGRQFLLDANARLNGIQLTVRGHNSLTGGHKVSAHQKQAILQDQVGLANNPVVAEYSIGLVSEHYAPVGRYFISVRPGNIKSVHVLTTDHHDLFRSLSDPWILGELGVYYIGY